ncbi:hypothetical protein PAXINDRAFT_18968 [Paxillus involutus ATCC 200175]|uniref:peptidyl-tRNA hydrolase n=1 Tax=Paxillus involutus ATCC 200175 TaxID=664439 RepID=A0A0C9T9T9_PAXIN|nr:hypothetical protein PAXINDRAFT_18968 [Paxillus involutus ATCC 200175]
MAQAAHAATAVLHETHGRAETIDYLADLENMCKVVLQAGDVHTPDASALGKLSAALSSTDPSPIPHYLWTEQPENVPTCIAIAPNRKEKPIRRAMDKSSCRLWRSD